MTDNNTVHVKCWQRARKKDIFMYFPLFVIVQIWSCVVLQTTSTNRTSHVHRIHDKQQTHSQWNQSNVSLRPWATFHSGRESMYTTFNFLYRPWIHTTFNFVYARYNTQLLCMVWYQANIQLCIHALKTSWQHHPRLCMHAVISKPQWYAVKTHTLRAAKEFCCKPTALLDSYTDSRILHTKILIQSISKLTHVYNQ